MNRIDANITTDAMRVSHNFDDNNDGDDSDAANNSDNDNTL